MNLSLDNLDELNEFAQRLNWVAPDNPIIALAVAGEGNMNHVLRGTRTDGSTLIFKQSLPYVAKYPEIPAPIERLDFEALFYAEVAQQGDLRIRTPEIVGYSEAARLLCMQDLGEARDLTSLYQARDRATDARNAAVSTLVYWLWKLHALSPEQTEGRFSNHAMRKLNHEHIFEIPYQQDNGVTLGPQLEQTAQTLRSDNKLTNIAQHCGQIYLGNEEHTSAACLLHGDFYPGSWIAHKRMGVMVIDPEFGFIGPPEFDIGVMLAHLAFAGFDQSNIMRLMQAYVQPPGFEFSLATKFAGLEIIRRLLGVAQLPLSASDDAKNQLLKTAHAMVLNA